VALRSSDSRTLHFGPGAVKGPVLLGKHNYNDPSRRMRWAGHVVRMWRRSVTRNACSTLVGKTPLVRDRRKWEDNIKINHRVIKLGGMDGIDAVQNRER
jgi:hypothetical protein